MQHYVSLLGSPVLHNASNQMFVGRWTATGCAFFFPSLKDISFNVSFDLFIFHFCLNIFEVKFVNICIRKSFYCIVTIIMIVVSKSWKWGVKNILDYANINYKYFVTDCFNKNHSTIKFLVVGRKNKTSLLTSSSTQLYKQDKQLFFNFNYPP